MRLVEWLTPPSKAPIPPRTYIIDILWATYGSVAAVLPRLPFAIAKPALVHAREAFYWASAIAQIAILFLPFVDIMSLPLVLNLGAVLAVLIVREGYILDEDRADCEAITSFMTPGLILLFNVVLGFARPDLKIPDEVIIPRAFKLALPIALCRFLLAKVAKEPEPEHPYKGLLRLGNRTWLFNGVWAAGALTLIGCNEQAAPPILLLQAFFISSLTVHAFTISMRLQLNPLDGISRHHRIQVSLNTDPYLDDLRLRRYYLLTGADWFSGFSMTAFLEMLFFFLLPLPLLIGLVELYAGHPNTARISVVQMAANGAGSVALLLTWVQVKKLNRQTAAAFDEKIRELTWARTN